MHWDLIYFCLCGRKYIKALCYFLSSATIPPKTNTRNIVFSRHRTNGRVRTTRYWYSDASVCRRLSVCLSVSLSVRNVLWLNGASWSKSYYWQPIGSRIWEIDWFQNEWPWPLFRGRIKVMLTIALHLTLNISKTVRDRRLVPIPKDHQ